MVSIATASVAAAHFGSSAQIIVTSDFILPGQEFEVVAIDLTPGASIDFEIRREEAGLAVPLEEATSSADGHFRVNMSIPGHFPDGYAQLFAIAEDGTQAMTWVLVGQPTASTPSPPGTGPWYADPSVIVLAALVLASVSAATLILLRHKNRPSFARKGR